MLTDMRINNIALPPSIILVGNTLYAAQRDIYAFEASNGTLRQRYAMQGFVNFTVAHDILYMNVSKHPDYIVQTMRVSDGAPLWSYQVKERLSGAPAVVNGVVYVSVIEGFVYALQATDENLLWQYKVELDVDVPAFLGPILAHPPTVVNEVVYVAPAVDPPLEPLLYALQAKNGTLLWKAPLPESPSFFSPIVRDDVIYISTLSSYIALRARDGSLLWQHNMPKQSRSSSVIMNGSVYVGLHQLGMEATLYSLQASDGILQWQNQLGMGTIGEYLTTPIVADNVVYVGVGAALIALRTDTGTVLWTGKTGGTALSSPVMDNGMVYVGANDGYVYLFRTDDGSLAWQAPLGGGKVVMHTSISLGISAENGADEAPNTEK